MWQVGIQLKKCCRLKYFFDSNWRDKHNSKGNWTSLIRSNRCRTSNLFLLLQKSDGGKFSAEKVEQIIHNILCDLLLTDVQVSSKLINIKPKLCFINMINMGYCGKSHWNGVKSRLLTKFKFSQERLGGFCSEFHQWKTKPYLLLLWNNFSFLLISFWSKIPNKMDAFLLGHSVD